MTPPNSTLPAEQRAWYSRPGPLTDLTAHAEALRELPEEVASLCEVVQGLLIHGHLGHLYGLEFDNARSQREINFRGAAQRLTAMLESDDRPLSQPREPSQRQIGTCRDFSLLLCALLRWQGRPARARCGFGGYFVPGQYEDHWVCEYWDDEDARWRLVDAQIDAVQRRSFGPADPLDVTRKEFVVGGEAWAGVRSGQLDASRFGLTTIKESGLWFICGDFVRDVAALNKVELLPWDIWGVMLHPAVGSENGFELGADEIAARLPADDLAELDRVAALSHRADDLSALRDCYQDARWQVPTSHPALRGRSGSPALPAELS